jgi:hypothetical protein
MLDGHGVRGPLARLQANGELRYDYKDLPAMAMPGEGLLRDFFRLAQSKNIKNDASRLLILILNTYPTEKPTDEYRAENEADTLGRLLLQVTFGDPEDEQLILNNDGLVVKIWRIQSPEARIGK